MIQFIMGVDALRLFKDNVGDEAYVETPEGKFTPINAVPIITDCRIASNRVYFGYPAAKGEHLCQNHETQCDTYEMESNDLLST